jgi:hypothetical protein
LAQRVHERRPSCFTPSQTLQTFAWGGASGTLNLCALNEMAESPEQKYERLQKEIQQSILRDYPNPNREGCPGDAAVRQVASRTELQKDELWQHITHCSPCYAEFLRYKSEVRAGEGHRLHTRRRALIAAGVTVVAGGGLSVFLLREPQVYNVDWDLDSQKSFRGLGEGQMEGPSGPPLSAPAARVRITVKMPNSSQPGRYILQFWKRLDSPPLFSETFEMRPGLGQVTIEADLTRAPPGSYTLGLRRTDVETWRYFPVTVSAA